MKNNKKDINSIKTVYEEKLYSEISSIVALKDGSLIISDNDGYIINYKIEKKDGKFNIKKLFKILVNDSGHLIAELDNRDLVISTFGWIIRYERTEEGLEDLYEIGEVNKMTLYDLKVLTHDRIAVCSNMNSIIIVNVNSTLLFSEIIIEDEEDKEIIANFGFFEHDPKETMTLFQIKNKEILVSGSADNILRFWNIEPPKKSNNDGENHICELIAKIKKVPTCINTTICQVENNLVVGGIGYINIICIIEEEGEHIKFEKSLTFNLDKQEIDTFSVCAIDDNFILCGGRQGELVQISLSKNNFAFDIKKENIFNRYIHFIAKIDEKIFAAGGKDEIFKIFEFK